MQPWPRWTMGNIGWACQVPNVIAGTATGGRVRAVASRGGSLSRPRDERRARRHRLNRASLFFHVSGEIRSLGSERTITQRSSRCGASIDLYFPVDDIRLTRPDFDR